MGTSPRLHAHLLQRITSQLRQTLASFGYMPADTPIIENANLFLTKAGDQLVEQLFTFSRSGRQLALRPEFTAAALYRYMVEDRRDAVRWQFSGPIFSDGPDRFTIQQHSAGAEFIGSTSPHADTEIMALAAQGAAGAGLKEWTLVIGHAGLLRLGLEQFGLESRTRRFLLQHRALLKNGASALLNALETYLNTPFDTAPVQGEVQAETLESVLAGFLDQEGRGGTMGGRRREDIARRLLQKQRQSGQHEQIEQAVGFLARWGQIRGEVSPVLDEISRMFENDPAAQGLVARWAGLIDNLGWYGIPAAQIVLQPDLALTWDYYTGVVFELHHRGGQSIAGGGRYDELARLLGSERDIPAVGFAYHLDRWLELPELTPTAQMALRLGAPDDTCEQAVTWALHLRGAGLTASLIYEPHADSIDAEIMISPDGSALYAGRSYRLDELPLLLEALKGHFSDDR